MIDYYLRFDDQPSMLAALAPLGMTYTDEEGNEHLSQGGHKWAAWQVGEIPGRDGWHVNLRVIDPELDVSALEQYRVYPQFPKCVWA